MTEQVTITGKGECARVLARNESRLLVIIPSGYCFGLQNVTFAFFEELPRNASCHFLITHWSDQEFPSRLKQLNIPFTPAWLGMFSRKMDWKNLKMTLECFAKLPSAYLVFLKLYRQFRPARILLANYHEAILLWPILIFLRRQVVCHMHDPPPAILFQRISYRFWRLGVGKFVFISANAKARLAKVGPLTRNDAVVPNGVAIRALALPRKRADFFCQRFGWPSNSLIVGMTGQMAPVKGHEDFIAAAAAISRSNPRARFVIGGKKTEPFFSKLQKIISSQNLEGVIQFGGWLETSAQFFESIDLFVLPSRHDEGFGLVVAEAGERGVATVATRSGGAVEIIINNETGILVNKQSPTELAAAIQKLLTDDRLREKVGTNARERIARHFNLSRQRSAFFAAITSPVG